VSDPDLQTSVARAAAVVDDRFGVVRQLAVHEVGPSDPPFFFATAQLASTRPFSDALASMLNGGAGVTLESALMGALGEAIERYRIGTYREDGTFRASFREVESVAMDPARLIFFAEEQYGWPNFPYARFDPRTSLSWVAGVSLSDGRERLVPASRVYTPYAAPRAEERLLQSTSTGAACHVEKQRAVVLGLYDASETRLHDRVAEPSFPRAPRSERERGKRVRGARALQERWTRGAALRSHDRRRPPDCP
jgi:ribosomal protein S12 methylthiotransferase accessory factor